MYIDTPEVQSVARAAFPGYTGRTFQVKPFQGPMNLASYWAGGSRDYFTMINLQTGKVAVVPENGTPYTAQVGQLTTLPLGCALVRHTIFSGKDLGITVYVNPDNLNRFALPAPVDLTEDERIVLRFTASLKSSYAGVKNYRFHQANRDNGVTLERWETAKQSCKDKGLLNKAGAITNEGRNQLGRVR